MLKKELYNQLSPALYMVCLRYARYSDEAKDFLQDSFIKIFDSIKKYKFQGSFEGWAKKLAINEILQTLRKKNALQESLDISQEPFENKNVYSLETEKSDLLHLINKLPQQKKIIFNLYAIEGYTHKEIAKQMGITENACSSMYHKAKTQLQSMYKEINNSPLD